jgi:hypothetical protein
MKRISYPVTGLLAFFLLFCLSCSDHGPEGPKVLPKIKSERLDIVITPGAPNLDYTFNLTFEDLGNVPIKEFGIVLDYAETANDTYHTVPTILDHKIKFNAQPKLGKQSQFDVGPAQSFSKMYYRAYAILQDDSAIYGADIFDFD